MKSIMIRGLWLPVLWMTALGIDIVAFSTGRPTQLIPRLFEDLVFVASFLFYGIDIHVASSTEIFLRFFLQFAFWWLVGCALVWAYLRSRIEH